MDGRPDRLCENNADSGPNSSVEAEMDRVELYQSPRGIGLKGQISHISKHQKFPITKLRNL